METRKTSNSGGEECLLHHTEVNRRELMNAVCNGDVKTAKQLIEKGCNVNFILDGWTPLHATIILESMDMLELLLSQPNIDLNILNERKVTPLAWSLFAQKELFILRLIRAGCDINICNKKEETPLHLSVLYSAPISVTHELLKRGADVNAQCFYSTALHCAVQVDNLEVVCILLYYNADVFIKNNSGHTPFSLALYNENFEIVTVLRDYYSFLDDDINYFLDIAFLKYDAELFKQVWPRFDSEIILSKCPEFIENYLNWCNYSTSDWVECLYLILNSDIAFDLIEHCMLNTNNFFDTLMNSMSEQEVESEDRIGLLYMVLRLGFEIEIKNFNLAVALYGLSQDIAPFIYGTYSSIPDDSKFICPLHAFVIGMETDYSIKNISQLFHDALEEWIRISQYHFSGILMNEDILAETCIKPVAFFSFPADVKHSIINLDFYLEYKLCDLVGYSQNAYVTMLKEQLQKIPEFPSLMELSRNQMHKYLVQKFRFKQPYQLQDCVKKLLIPNKIKDILFKEPIY